MHDHHDVPKPHFGTCLENVRDISLSSSDGVRLLAEPWPSVGKSTCVRMRDQACRYKCVHVLGVRYVVAGLQTGAHSARSVPYA
jgi:hypothetical protein